MPGYVWSALGLIMAIAGALGISYAVFRSTTVTKTLELYKGENEVQGKAIARQAVVLVEQEARITTLEKENEVLRNLVIGHEQLEMLVKDTVARSIQHQEQLDALNDIKELLEEMWRATIRALAPEQKK